jgi:CRP-like cAMP-binding protein
MWVASPRRLEATANQFFARLPLDVRFELERHLEYVSLSVGKGLYERGAQAHHLLLPLTCVVGLVNVSEDGASTLVALVGAEGLVGLPALLSGRVASVEALVCTPGLAMRVPAELLRQAFVSDPAVQKLVHGYMQAFVAEMIETAHCARHHGTLQQLSVLILRANDKQGSGELLLTHERLAGMLGLRRETVSHAAQALQARGLFTYRRGHVHVTDRAGLESVACGCYARIQRVYRDVYSES